MKYLNKLIGIVIFFALLSTALCADKHVTIEIDYGGLHQNQKAAVTWKQGITALEVLQSVAKVKTQQRGEHYMVTSIDNVEGQIDGKVWYYDINGKRATSFANKCMLKEGDHMKWEYTKDVCSSK